MKSKINFLSLAKQAAAIADDKKASDIVILNVRRFTALADYFIIATADSVTQMTAIANALQKTFKEQGITPIHRDGIGSSKWSVIDFGGLVIHIMNPDARDLYDLERKWDGARKVKFVQR
jgi:ribosome-associated protein